MFIVEQQGIEPWSKHGINMLSTCLSFYWFSNIVRKKAPKRYLIFCYFALRSKKVRTNPKLTALRMSVGIR